MLAWVGRKGLSFPLHQKIYLLEIEGQEGDRPSGSLTDNMRGRSWEDGSEATRGSEQCLLMLRRRENISGR